jgi:hypothetical protein
MGVSPECVAAVVDASGGRFDDREAAELIRYLEALKRAEEAAGNIDGLAARVQDLAAKEADRTRIAAAQAKRHAALAAVAYERTLRQVRELVQLGRRHDQALLAVFEGDGQRGLANGRDSVQATQAAYLQRWTADWAKLLAGNDRIRKLTETGDQAFHLAVLREMRELREGGSPGITRDADALTVARLYAAMGEASRIDRNRYGASIGRLDGWNPQSHDSLMVAKAGRDQWIRDILPELDLARTYPNMNQAQIQRLLSDTFDHIAMGMRAGRTGADPLARIGPANLANRLGAARELHFRDAESWERYRQKYGGEGIHGAMLGHLRRAARDAALMEKLGPNPEAMLDRLRRDLAMEAAADTSRSVDERNTAVKRITAPTGAVADAWAEAAGITSQPVNTRLADIMAGIRNQQRAAKLAGAALSQMTDPVIRAARLTARGAPVLETYMRSIGMWWGDLLHTRRVPPELREALASVSAGLDGMRNAAWADLMPEDRRPGTLSRLTELTMKVQGMTFLARKLRDGTAYMQAEYMGRQAGKDWSGLDSLYRRALAQYGITPAMWDAMRARAAAIDGKRFVTPDLAREIPEAELAAMAQPQLEAMQQGMAAKIADRARRNAEDQAWLAKRVIGFNEGLARAQQRMAKASERSKAAGAAEQGRLRERMTELQTALLDLAEAPPVSPFTPMAERAAIAGGAPGRLAQAEGRMMEKLDRLRRAIGRVGQEAVRTDIGRLEDFEAAWRKKAAELEAFAARVEQRAKTRAAADLADRFDWEPRVQRVLDDTRRDVELAFGRFFADEMLGSTLEPDAQMRRFLYQGTQPGTVKGEALRAIALFKSFPIAYAQRVISQAVLGFGEGERGKQLAHVGGLIAMSTVLGYAAMTAKDLVRGYGPRDPTNYKTWIAAMAQGGGIGIYGDFLFGQGNRFGNSALETVAGPALSGAANLIGIWQRAKDGEAKAGDALGVVLRETPFINLWWARPVLDALILNSLREWASPGTLRRQAREREKDYGQERWAPETVWR